ncbi:MAG: hypothetical protein AAB820_02245 [Patescibacteria group bacterium]
MKGQEIIQKILNFLNYIYNWFENNIFNGLVSLFKIIGGLIIKILEFLIDLIKSLISYL